jgi:hypothetical protein
MENEPNKIDDLFRDTLKGYEPEPSRKVWRGIGIMLALGEFLRFSFTNFSQNIFQLLVAGGAASAIVVGAVSLFSPDSDQPKRPTAVNKPPIEVQQPIVEDLSQQTAADNIVQKEPEQRVINYKQRVDQLEPEQLLPQEPTAAATVLPIAPVRSQLNGINAIEASGLLLQFAVPTSNSNMADYGQFLRNQLLKYQESYVPTTSYSLTAAYSLDQLNIAKATQDAKFLYNSADLGFRIQKGNVYLQTGISAAYQFDNGLYSVSSKSYDSVGFYYNVHYYVPDPSHPESVILVTSKVTLYDTITHHETVQTTNKYLSIQVPLIVGYRLANFKRFSVYAFGGPIVQFIANKEEPSLAYIASDLYPFQVSNQSLPRLDTYWQMTGGLRASVILNRRFSFELEPNYKWYFTNMYKGTKFRNPFSIGLRAGVSFSF